MSRQIEWRHDRRRVVVPVTVLAPYPYHDLEGVAVDALLDTGSTTSAVTRSIAAKLALPHRGKRLMSGLGGEVIVTRRAFRFAFITDDVSGEVPQFPYVFEEVIGFELQDGFSCDALIGMDILTQCSFTMSDDRTCRLAFR